MIDISTALQNILKAVYGRDVRESIHDAIYQINANANEAIDLAQIKFGTAVNSPTDPITGFTENSVYLNVNTGIMWRLEGGSWVKKGTFKSIDSISLSGTSGLIDTYTITFTDGSTSNYTVKNGADGKSITGITKTSTSGNVDHYDVDLSDGSTISGFDVTNGTNGADGSDGKSIANISLASTSGNVKTYDVILDDGTKTPTGFSIEDGASSYLHIRYSSSFDGTGMVTTPTDATVYIGILVSTSSVAPTNPSLYSWVRFIGKSGTGSGDMLSADYATKYPNTVDKAAALYDGTNEILANQLMQKSVYDADDDGIVDNANHAVNADNVGNADTSLLEKLSDNSGTLNYNGNALMLEAAQFANQAKLGEFVVNRIGNNVKELALHSNITTKLSKVDTTDNLSVELAKKIDKPSSATEGQVLTYRNNEWVADDSQGGGQFVIIAKGEDYEGQTVTATKGTKSKSAVITSGVARISVDEGGVWTLTLSSGLTSKTPNMTYYGEYEVTLGPNGSIVTPTDNIQVWLNCAGITESYTTISQVLADTNTLSALISDNNAVNYMVRSTTWASDVCNNESAMTYIGLNNYCANKLLADSTWCTAICNSTYFEKVLNVSVPTLTGDSTKVTKSAEISNTYAAWKAFGNGLWLYGKTDGGWIGYDFDNPILVKKVGVNGYGDGSNRAKQVSFYGTNDKSNWGSPILTQTLSGKDEFKEFNVNFKNYYKYFKCVVDVGAGGANNWNNGLAQLQFYGREEA